VHRCGDLSLLLDMTLLFGFASEVVDKGMGLTGCYPFVYVVTWAGVELSGVAFLYAVVTCDFIR
jgi:hypothetical protein